MENQIKAFFKELMEEERKDALTIAKVVESVNSSSLDKETKDCIISEVNCHTACELRNEENKKEMKEEGLDVEDMKALTVSPYGGAYALECEGCYSVIVDLEGLLDECCNEQ